MGRIEGLQTALINRRFAGAIQRRFLRMTRKAATIWLTNVAAARVLVGDGNPMTFVLMAVGLLVTAAGLVDDRIWYSDQCVQPGQHAHHFGHDRGRRRPDPDRARGCARSIAADRRGAQKQSAGPRRRHEAKPPRLRRRGSRRNAPDSTARCSRRWPPNCRVPGAAARSPSRRARPSRRTPSEPRFPATASEPAPGPLDWLRAKSKPVTTPVPSAPVPPRHVRTADGRTDRRSAAVAALAATAGDAAGGRSRRSSRRSGRRTAMPVRRSRGCAPRPEQPMPRATPQVEPAKEKERFDLVWPDRGAAPAPSEPRSEVKPESVRRRADPRPRMPRAGAVDMPLPPIPARPREMRPASERRMPKFCASRPPSGDPRSSSPA